MGKQSPKKPAKKEKDKSTKKIEPDLKDLKAIQVVDIVLAKNKELGIEPQQDHTLSLLISSNRNRSLISRVRTRERHIPESAIIKLSELFGVDMNFFFFKDVVFDYNPLQSEKVSATHYEANNKGINNIGEGSVTTLVEGDNKGKIIGIVKGNVYEGNKIIDIAQNAEKIVNEFKPDQREIVNDILDPIKSEAAKIENRILKKTEDIKKMQVIYEEELRLERQRRQAIESELSEVKDEHYKLLKDYRTLVKKQTK